MISDFRVLVKVDLGDGNPRDMDVRELEGPIISHFSTPEGEVETVEYRLNGRVVHRSMGVVPASDIH